MEFHGQYKFFFPESVAKRHGIPTELTIKNTVVAEGDENFLRAITRNEAMGLAGSPALFYVGLCNSASVADSDVLTTLVTEPTVTFGYSRKSVERNSTGWPTIDTVNGQRRAASKVLTFTASGGNFSAAFSRAFLCSVASGTGGLLFSVSGALTVPVQLLDGESFQLQYELYIR